MGISKVILCRKYVGVIYTEGGLFTDDKHSHNIYIYIYVCVCVCVCVYVCATNSFINHHRIITSCLLCFKTKYSLELVMYNAKGA